MQGAANTDAAFTYSPHYARGLARQNEILRQAPFSADHRAAAQQACVDFLQDAPGQVATAARMFEHTRRDSALAPALRHAVLDSVERGLLQVSAPYRVAGAPLGQLARLDAWCDAIDARVCDAIARVEAGVTAIPLSPDEQKLETQQHALLTRVAPEAGGRVAQLCETAGHRGISRAWNAQFIAHLRRLLLLTFDATIGAADLNKLHAFLLEPSGLACLHARADYEALACVSHTSSATDPPEMTALQGAMLEQMYDAAGNDADERQAYLFELSRRMAQALRAEF